ncbi:MAG: glycosyltransferase family 4 protein [Roseiflexaceae bacterium]
MRVLIIGLGGITRTFRNWPERTLGQALVRAGHQVDAITYHQPQQPHLGLSERHEQIDGVNVWRVTPQLYPAGDLMLVLRQLPRPDIAHIVHPRNVLAFQAVRWLRAQGVPVVWTWLGPYHDRWLVPDRERPYEHRPHPELLIETPQQLLRRSLISLNEIGKPGRFARTLQDHWRNYAIHAPLRWVDGLLPCSQHEADVLAQLGFGHLPTRVVPLWLDMEFMHGPAPALDLPFTRPIIPYIGQLTVRKCYDMVVAAMPAIVARFPQASFVFVTHNPEQRANLQAMAAAQGVAANLHFLGTISEEQKLALLRASDLLPFPSRYEGFGLPVLEAMAAETPVISTDIPVINELITHDVSGLLIPYDDVAALSQAMLAVLEQPLLRQRLIEGGKRALAQQFDPQQRCAEVVAFYQQVQR